MGYVVAAYAIAIGAVALYLAHLVRERGRLLRDLGARRPGAAPAHFAIDFAGSVGISGQLASVR